MAVILKGLDQEFGEDPDLLRWMRARWAHDIDPADRERKSGHDRNESP
jgi:hypothetical protein